MNQLFRGLIVVLLLGLYVYTVYDAIVVAQCLGTKGCTDYSADSFSAGFSHAMSLIGGLVSALVISALAITPAGGNPGEPELRRAAGQSKGQFGRYRALFSGLVRDRRCGLCRWLDALPVNGPAADRSWTVLAGPGIDFSLRLFRHSSCGRWWRWQRLAQVGRAKVIIRVPAMSCCDRLTVALECLR